jgi:hypothetical protein
MGNTYNRELEFEKISKCIDRAAIHISWDDYKSGKKLLRDHKQLAKFLCDKWGWEMKKDLCGPIEGDFGA